MFKKVIPINNENDIELGSAILADQNEGGNNNVNNAPSSAASSSFVPTKAYKYKWLMKTFGEENDADQAFLKLDADLSAVGGPATRTLIGLLFTGAHGSGGGGGAG